MKVRLYHGDPNDSSTQVLGEFDSLIGARRWGIKLLKEEVAIFGYAIPYYVTDRQNNKLEQYQASYDDTPVLTRMIYSRTNHKSIVQMLPIT